MTPDANFQCCDAQIWQTFLYSKFSLNKQDKSKLYNQSTNFDQELPVGHRNCSQLSSLSECPHQSNSGLGLLFQIIRNYTSPHCAPVVYICAIILQYLISSLSIKYYYIKYLWFGNFLKLVTTKKIYNRNLKSVTYWLNLTLDVCLCFVKMGITYGLKMDGGVYA